MTAAAIDGQPAPPEVRRPGTAATAFERPDAGFGSVDA